MKSIKINGTKKVIEHLEYGFFSPITATAKAHNQLRRLAITFRIGKRKTHRAKQKRPKYMKTTKIDKYHLQLHNKKEGGSTALSQQ